MSTQKIKLFSASTHSLRHLENVWGHTSWSSDKRIEYIRHGGVPPKDGKRKNLAASYYFLS